MHLQRLIINLVAMRVLVITGSYLVTVERVSSMYTPTTASFNPIGLWMEKFSFLKSSRVHETVLTSKCLLFELRGNKCENGQKTVFINCTIHIIMRRWSEEQWEMVYVVLSVWNWKCTKYFIIKNILGRTGRRWNVIVKI